MTRSNCLTTTRDAYDAVASDYARLVGTELTDATEGPVDRALLAAFAELVKSNGLGPACDAGCGPGRIAAHLATLGLSAVGVDLSPAMIEVARQAHPDLQFEVGSLTALEQPDGAFGGLVAWYSIIHTPPAHLPRVFTEFKRVLAPGGHVLLAFQVGESEHVHREEAYGHAVSLDNYRHSIEHVAELLEEVGLMVQARAFREPIQDSAGIPHRSPRVNPWALAKPGFAAMAAPFRRHPDAYMDSRRQWAQCGVERR